MQRRYSRGQCRGFTVLEITVVICIVGFLTAGMVIAVQPTWAAVDIDWAQKNCSSLNLAMTTYRGYLARGYTPSSSWSASSAAGVLAELAKPLQRGGIQITVMPAAAQANLSIGKLVPSTFTSAAVWSVVP